MNYLKTGFNVFILLIIILFLSTNSISAQMNKPKWIDNSVEKLLNEIKVTDTQENERFMRCLKQTSVLWTDTDGDAQAFENFVNENYCKTPEDRKKLLDRIENIFEKIDGHMAEIGRELRTQMDLDLGPLMPVDEIFAGYSPAAHLNDDFFNNKLAFIILLNFPITTLQENLTEGKNWSREKWAEVRLAQQFAARIPAEVNLEIARAGSEADKYISEYNIWMHHLLDDKGDRHFPEGMSLLSHWNLRDEIKANYENKIDGLTKQKMIQKVMERIVTQTIPEVVINNPAVDWDPYTNEVKKSEVKDYETSPVQTKEVNNHPEPDTRYRMLQETFIASKKEDPYWPSEPTMIARRFDLERQLPEERVKKMFESILSSDLVPQIGKLIEKRLGRTLEPFDIWYNGFKARNKYSETELNKIVAEKYPSPEAFEKDIPRILKHFGFSEEKANLIAANIVVDPARGSGHAMGAAMRSAKAHLRTRVGKGGMDYKGFNIAVHELGHNVEQTISLNLIDHTLLNGVPNTAFTEALAFVFQGHDLELLGLSSQDENAKTLKNLNDFWAAYEIAGVSLVDMAAWHWMYDHPDANPQQLKEAVLSISKDIWNKYYAPVFNKKDVMLLGIYSHMIHSFLYLPDYTIGHVIAHQIEVQMEKAGNIGKEFERIVLTGNVTPDLWMEKATGSPVSAEALINSAREAINLDH